MVQVHRCTAERPTRAPRGSAKGWRVGRPRVRPLGRPEPPLLGWLYCTHYRSSAPQRNTYPHRLESTQDKPADYWGKPVSLLNC